MALASLQQLLRPAQASAPSCPMYVCIQPQNGHATNKTASPASSKVNEWLRLPFSKQHSLGCGCKMELSGLQETVRGAFKECTVLTVAHRLHTIMDSDQVLVLDAGRVQEMAAPRRLLQVLRSPLHISYIWIADPDSLQAAHVCMITKQSQSSTHALAYALQCWLMGFYRCSLQPSSPSPG